MLDVRGRDVCVTFFDLGRDAPGLLGEPVEARL
jgi:hypothetical protein